MVVAVDRGRHSYYVDIAVLECLGLVGERQPSIAESLLQLGGIGLLGSVVGLQELGDATTVAVVAHSGVPLCKQQRERQSYVA